MTAIATRAPRAPRPTWAQAFWAVVGGSILGGIVAILGSLLLPLGLPMQ